MPALGVVLILVGPVVGLVPGPGGILVFGLGLALLATEVRPAAKSLDWLEPRLRSGGRRAQRFWSRLPAAGKVALSTLCLVMVGAFGSLAFVFLLRN